MEHALHVRKLVDNFHAVLMCLALMDDDRKRKLLRQRHLHPERRLLHVARHVLVVII